VLVQVGMRYFCTEPQSSRNKIYLWYQYFVLVQVGMRYFCTEPQSSRNKTYIWHQYLCSYKYEWGIFVEDLSHAQTKLTYGINILCWYKMNEDLRNIIHAKFGYIWPSCLRGYGQNVKKFTDRLTEGQTQIDGKI